VSKDESAGANGMMRKWVVMRLKKKL